MTKLEETFRFIITEFYLNTEFCKPLISATLKALILRILSEKRGNTAKKDNNPDRIRSIIEYIALNYDKEITNTKIAEEFCYNPSYINRVFRENTGMGIHKFLINYRINSAIELLSNKNLSVFAVALSVGFTDISHFSKMFKKKTGKSPADYRKNM